MKILVRKRLAHDIFNGGIGLDTISTPIDSTGAKSVESLVTEVSENDFR